MKTLLGGILIAIGLLIACVSGLCSGIMLMVMMGRFSEDPSEFFTLLLFGGLPFAGGVAMIIGGRALIKHAREEEAGR